MRQLDMKRKQTSSLPWLAGLVILGLVVWAVTSLLAAAPEEVGPTADAAYEDELTPAPLPMQVNPIGVTPVRDVTELAPLDQEDVGQRLRAEGEVLATGTAGFWMLAGSEVIRVDSEQIVRKGQTVQIQGTLREDDPEMTEQIAAEVLSRSPQPNEWRVVRGVKLVEERDATPAGAETPSES
jgi:hypothetical protein